MDKIEGGEIMASLENKKVLVSEITEKMKDAKSFIVTDYRGLNVAQVTKLRSELRNAGIEYRVLKNTLMTIAADDAGLEGIQDYFKGPTAVAFGYDDAVAPAQILSKFAKEFDALEIKAGVLEGKAIGYDEIKALAELPSREVLLAKLANVMQSPIAGMANVLQGPIRKLGYALVEIEKQKAQ